MREHRQRCRKNCRICKRYKYKSSQRYSEQKAHSTLQKLQQDYTPKRCIIKFAHIKLVR